MANPIHVLVFGASYGALLGIKLALAGHRVTLVCRPEEADVINREGIRVHLPRKGREGLVEIASKETAGTVLATTPERADVGSADLVALAMQEPQYRAGPVRQLLGGVARAEKPCMSIMNMPPLTYLARIPGLDVARLRGASADPTVWDLLDPKLVTLASPDPQAFRPPEEGPNVLQVSLPTNFKVAAFEDPEHTAMLRRLEADIDAVRWPAGGDELPVKLRVHDSVFVPLAKWAMLLTGNYRCVTPSGPRSIAAAVHDDPQASREVYDWVRAVCMALGAAPSDLVPFEKYAAAAKGLVKPSSAARALYAGAPAIERVDRLVQAIAASRGMRNATVDETVALVDAQLEHNREAA